MGQWTKPRPVPPAAEAQLRIPWFLASLEAASLLSGMQPPCFLLSPSRGQPVLGGRATAVPSKGIMEFKEAEPSRAGGLPATQT